MSMTVNGLSSASQVDYGQLLGSGADLSFIVYAMQIDQLDKNLRSVIEEVQQVNKQREAINHRLSELRDWKSFITEHGEGDGDAKKVFLLDWNDNPNTPQIGQDDFSIASDGTVQTKPGPGIGTAKTVQTFDADGQFRTHCGHEVSIAEVDKEIARLQGIGTDLDNGRDIKNIMMNQQLNKKEQAVTQLTNFIKKANDVQSAIIANLK